MPLPYDGPFGAADFGLFWTDGETFHKNGPLTAVEMSYINEKISAIRSR